MNTQRELTVDKLVQMNRAAIEGTKPIKEDDPMLRLVPQMIEALQWIENAAESEVHELLQSRVHYIAKKARDVLDQVEEA
tara:strand:+ start:819 stop:1058 length:240 start_codon:yes stop_codon:yes gene_type:complete